MIFTLGLGVVLVVCEECYNRLSVIGGLDYWNGLLEWTTGWTLTFFSPPQERTIYIEELV